LGGLSLYPIAPCHAFDSRKTVFGFTGMIVSGNDAGRLNTTGTGNAFYGHNAGWNNTSGGSNAFFGDEAGYNNTSAGNNAFYGNGAGFENTTGAYNTFVGTGTGSNNTTGNSNIYVGPNTISFSGTENNTIRIGTQGTGSGNQNVAYIAGIYGSASGGVQVYINSNGQLGTSGSSLRFKEQVRDMGDSSSSLLRLRPVTFLYKPEYDKGERTLQYGLIAEEVAKVYPELVAYDNDGRPYTVKYQLLAPMLLNELQKQHQRAAAEDEVVRA
jgi:trimeric autotransporter adhesin